ncbi:MAG: hypothetical protein V3U94_02270, partial [Candidatus Thorarchaeota archaeon]
SSGKTVAVKIPAIFERIVTELSFFEPLTSGQHISMLHGHITTPLGVEPSRHECVFHGRRM